MLYNAIIKPILEYCCTVWGNCSKENLIRLLRIQKRCARLILDAKFSDNSVKLFTKLGWLPIDDIIRSRKLDLLHKISFGHCPDYFIPYIHYLKDTHNYNTKATTKNNLVLPKFFLSAREFQVAGLSTQALLAFGIMWMFPFGIRHRINNLQEKYARSY